METAPIVFFLFLHCAKVGGGKYEEGRFSRKQYSTRVIPTIELLL